MSDLKLLEFSCPKHGRFDVLVPRAEDPDYATCPICTASSSWVISAPMVRNLTARVQAVTTAKSDERRPGMLDTRPLAEGMPMKEWRAKQDKARVERRHKQMVKNGLVTPKVIVG